MHPIRDPVEMSKIQNKLALAKGSRSLAQDVDNYNPVFLSKRGAVPDERATVLLSTPSGSRAAKGRYPCTDNGVEWAV